MSDNMINQYHRDGVFCPSKLKKSAFTTLAKGNCNLNVTSSIVWVYYHCTSITVMQYLTEHNQGDQFPDPAIVSNESSAKNVQSLPSSYVEIMPIFLPKYVPKSSTVTKKYDSNEVYIQERLNETVWLQKTSNNKHGDVLPKARSKYHVEKERVKSVINGINEILPVIRKHVHTLKLIVTVGRLRKTVLLSSNPIKH